MFEHCPRMFLHPWLGFTLWNVAAFFTHSSISNQPKKQKQKKKEMSPQRSLMETIYIEIYLKKKKKKYIIYGKMFHSFPPFFCCFTAVLSSWVFILARGHSNSVRRRVKYLFCGCQRRRGAPESSSSSSSSSLCWFVFWFLCCSRCDVAAALLAKDEPIK